MITPEVKKTLKEYLKENYTDDVLKILDGKSIVNRNKQPYSPSMIKNVLNGHQANIEIEKALTIVYNRRKKKFNKHQLKLQQVLQKN